MAKFIETPISGFLQIAANPLRHLLVIQNKHQSPVYLIIDGDAEAAGLGSLAIVARGVRLEAWDTVILTDEEAKVAIYGCDGTGSSTIILSAQEG